MSRSSFVPGPAEYLAGVAGQLNTGVYITKVTDAQRSAYTPASGEIVYATDTHLFWVGDGATAGGVASDCGLSAQQLVRLGIIIPRHRRFLPQLRYAKTSGATGNIPSMVTVGNSIVQGTGATSSATDFNSELGIKLAAYAGFGTSGQWTPVQYGIGATTIATAVSFLADIQDIVGNYSDPKRSTLWSTQRQLAILMDMRNDPVSLGAGGVSDYATLLDVALLQIKKHNCDAMLVIENPQITFSTGALVDTYANFGVYREAALQTCSQEQVSVVDAWWYFALLRAQGIDTKPFYAADGVHPNDAGHLLIAGLIYQCLLAQQGEAGPAFTDRPVTDQRVAAYANYYSTVRAVSTLGTTDANGTTNADTAACSRKVQLTGDTAYPIPAAGFVKFTSPGGAKGVIVQYYTDSNNTGRPSLSYNSVTPTGAVTSGQRWDGFQSDGVTTLAGIGGSVSRQYDVYYSFIGQNTSFVDDQPGQITIAANGGQITVLGVTWIMGDTADFHQVWPYLTSSGSGWSSSPFAGGEPARLDSTPGDYDLVTFYGVGFSCIFETGAGAGKVDITVDGGTPLAAQDLYTASTAQNFAIQVAKNLALGWHTVKIAVDAAKNASSSGFAVKWGHGYAEMGVPDPSYTFITLGSGETINVAQYWRTATIYQTISGTPVLTFAQWGSTISCASGACIVRLSR